MEWLLVISFDIHKVFIDLAHQSNIISPDLDVGLFRTKHLAETKTGYICPVLERQREDTILLGLREILAVLWSETRIMFLII